MYGNRWMCTRNMIFGQFCVNFDTKRTLVTLMLDGSYAHVRAQNQNSKETPNFASSLIISYLRYHSSCHQSLISQKTNMKLLIVNALLQKNKTSDIKTSNPIRLLEAKNITACNIITYVPHIKSVTEFAIHLR